MTGRKKWDTGITIKTDESMKTNVLTTIISAAVFLFAIIAESLLHAQEDTSNYIVQTTHTSPDSTLSSRREIS